MELSAVVQQVQAAGVVPLDPHHLAVLLEMEGWNDERARRLGFADLFHLAREAFPHVAQGVRHRQEPPPPARTLLGWAGLALFHFLRGVVFALPMVMGSAASLYAGVSLGAYAGFSVAEATGVALGTMASFLTTGGFIQAMARRGLFLMSLGEYGLALRASLQMLAAGVVCALALQMAAAAAFALFPILSPPTLRMAGLYYPVLSVIWLAAGMLYMLQQEVLFVALTAVAVGLVLGLHRWLPAWGLAGGARVIVAQMAGLAFLAGASLVAALYLFWRLERRSGAGTARVLPGWTTALRSLYPFWAYGLLYVALLYMDRFLAWSTPDEFHPQVVWFIGHYELGLNWASLSLLAPMGVVEVGVRMLTGALYRLPVAVPAQDRDAFGRRLCRFLGAVQVAVVAVAVPAALAPLPLMRWLLGTGAAALVPLAHPVSRWVFWWGSLGYVFLAGALLNAVLLFTVNQPWPAVRAVALAVAVDLAVGFLASRYGDLLPLDVAQGQRYPHAVFGLVAGAATFWWLAARGAHRVLLRADYLLYANT